MNNYAINFPSWADLGIDVSGDTRNTWDAEISRASLYWYYFSGYCFKEKVESEELSLEDAPLLYPVGVNIVKMMSLAHADAALGEWSEVPIQFAPRSESIPRASVESAISLANQILVDSNAGSLFWEIELERQVYGGAALRIAPSISSPSKIRWSRVGKGSFFPVWDPENPDRLLEVYVWGQITKRQARLKYGYDASTDMVNVLEKWSTNSMELSLNGDVISKYSGVNPYGVVPFVYIPRFRASNWYGEALTDDLIDVQNELNMRLADIGEAINYNAHPIKYGINLPSDFNAENYPIGPNAMWDLGRALGSSPPPEVGILEANNPIPNGSFEYVKFLYDWARTSTFAPPIAFGEDNGGGQRSGVTLEIRLWPMLKSIQRSRAYLASGIRNALYISGKILAQKNWSSIPVRAVAEMMSGSIQPRFANILPRDQAAIVDEVVKLLSTDPPSISLETAQVLLGRGRAEVDRIVNMLNDSELKGAQLGGTFAQTQSD